MSNDNEFYNIIINLNIYINKDKKSFSYTPSKISFELINQNQSSQNITISMKRKIEN